MEIFIISAKFVKSVSRQISNLIFKDFLFILLWNQNWQNSFSVKLRLPESCQKQERKSPADRSKFATQYCCKDDPKHDSNSELSGQREGKVCKMTVIIDDLALWGDKTVSHPPPIPLPAMINAFTSQTPPTDFPASKISPGGFGPNGLQPVADENSQSLGVSVDLKYSNHHFNHHLINNNSLHHHGGPLFGVTCEGCGSIIEDQFLLQTTGQ